MTDDQTVDEGLLIRRHHLPHWQAGGSWYFITFRAARDQLPPPARQVVVDCLLHGDGHTYDLSSAVVMPDHVHCLLRPTMVAPGCWYDLGRILQGVKGVSARHINQLLGTRGSVWQAERHDRIMRDEGEYEGAIWYIRRNPVEAGLAATPEEYPFLIERLETREVPPPTT